MRYQHIIWDWNGTLFDDAWLCIDIINRVLRDHGVASISAERYQHVFGFPLKEYYQALGFDFGQTSFEDLSTDFILEYEQRKLECGLREGATAALDRLAATNISQSVLSASRQDFLDDAAHQLGVTDYFMRLNGMDNHHGYSKVDIGQQWVAQLDVPSEAVLMIGDTVHDYEVAQAMDIACWLVPSGHQHPDRLACCGAPVFSSLEALPLAPANQ